MPDVLPNLNFLFMVKAHEGLSKREQRKRKREASTIELESILNAFKESQNRELVTNIYACRAKSNTLTWQTFSRGGF